MRTSRSPFVLPFACLLAIGVHVLPAPELRAQEPTPSGSAPAETAPARPARPSGFDQLQTGQDPRQGAGGRQRRGATVIEAGTVHPATGPAIQDGVVVIRNGRIAAVGKKGEVEVPPNATTRSYPDGHVYPGLIDAATDAYTDDALRGEGGLDAGLDLSLDLRPRNSRDDALASHGITTAYVTVRSPAQFRGQGTIVRPRANGFEAWPEKVRTGLQTRITNGPGATHALQRLAMFDAMQKQFDGLEDYRKAKKDYTEALLKYEKEFQEYLDYHQKKSGGTAGENKAPEGGAPAGERSARPEGAPRPTTREGRRGPPPGGGVAESPAGASMPAATEAPEALEAALLTLLEAVVQDPQPRPQGQPSQGAQGQGAQGGPNGAPAQGAPAKDEGPKRPTYPKKPPEDPTKEALLKVLDGELALRIEAHRPDEVRAALDLQKKHAIPLLVVEQAYGAAGTAASIAEQGAMVVLTEVLPGRMTKQYEAFDVMRLPAALQAAGAPFAIATGSARRAATLPLMAATAVAGGLDEDAALRAITLTPAEILGIAKDTGSLTEGKFADVLVTDRPLFASDSRVLLVLSQGRTEFEAK